MDYQFFKGKFIQTLPAACTLNIVPPVFAGIVSATPQANGSIQVGFAGAVDDFSVRLRYRIFIMPGVVTAAVLFQAANIVDIIEAIGLGPFTKNVFTLADQVTYLGINQTYTFGVRAVDTQGNFETNLVTTTAVSEGVLPDCLTTVASTLTTLALDLAGVGVELTAEIEDDNELTGEIEDC